MNNFVILTDTTCELSNEVLRDFNIEIVKPHFMDNLGNDHESFCDWSECTCFNGAADFYKTLKSNPSSFSTAPSSLPELINKMTSFVEKGLDLLCFTITSSMSGTFNFFNNAKSEVLKNYPDAKIYIVDSLRIGNGIGLMCIKAAILRSMDKSIDEVYSYMEENKNRFHQIGWLDDLSFVAKKGRITHSKAFFGQLIGIKPLGEFDPNGLITVLGKAKGEKAAYDAMLTYMDEYIENPSEQVILICHSTREKQANAYAALIKEKFNPKKIYINECGPSCGINIGPGLMAAYFIGKPVSADLATEKSFMEQILTK